ncbi:MAG TPA: FeoA family protein [Fimbriimonadales bacterium]|nr:FeoA family protein [Fimbriimonadales bacterium]
MPAIHSETILSQLSSGERAVILEVRVDGAARRRLLDLGFIPGAEVEVVMLSPWGDPTAYRIKGSQVALREEDASKIFVKRIGSGIGRKDDEEN